MRSAMLRCARITRRLTEMSSELGGRVSGDLWPPEIFWERVILETVASLGIALLSCALIANNGYRQTLRASFFPPRIGTWYSNVGTTGDGHRGDVGERSWQFAVLELPRAPHLQERSAFDRRSFGVGAANSSESREPPSGKWAVGGRRTTPSTRPATWLDGVRERTGTRASAVGSSTTPSTPAVFASTVLTSQFDPERPTILFIGESVMFVEGTSPNREHNGTSRCLMGVSRPQLGVHGSLVTNQAYLRLPTELLIFAGGGRSVDVHEGTLRAEPRSGSTDTFGQVWFAPFFFSAAGGKAIAPIIPREVAVPYRDDTTSNAV